jgi:hypothetical protein
MQILNFTYEFRIFKNRFVDFLPLNRCFFAIPSPLNFWILLWKIGGPVEISLFDINTVAGYK